VESSVSNDPTVESSVSIDPTVESSVSKDPMVDSSIKNDAKFENIENKADSKDDISNSKYGSKKESETLNLIEDKQIENTLKKNILSDFNKTKQESRLRKLKIKKKTKLKKPKKKQKLVRTETSDRYMLKPLLTHLTPKSSGVKINITKEMKSSSSKPLHVSPKYMDDGLSGDDDIETRNDESLSNEDKGVTKRGEKGVIIVPFSGNINYLKDDSLRPVITKKEYGGSFLRAH